MLKVAVQIQLIFEMVDTCLNTLYSLFSVSVVWGKVCPDINFNLLQIIATWATQESAKSHQKSPVWPTDDVTQRWAWLGVRGGTSGTGKGLETEKVVRFCQRVKCHFNCESTNVVHLFLHVESINVNNFLTMKSGRVDRQQGRKGKGRKESPDNGVTYSCCQETEQERTLANEGVMGQGSKGCHDNNFRKNHP